MSMHERVAGPSASEPITSTQSTGEGDACSPLGKADSAHDRSARLLVDTVQALLLVLDESGRVVEANGAVARSVGLPLHEVIGSDWVNRFVPPREHGRFGDFMDGSASTQEGSLTEGFILKHAGEALEERRILWKSAMRD